MLSSNVTKLIIAVCRWLVGIVGGLCGVFYLYEAIVAIDFAVRHGWEPWSIIMTFTFVSALPGTVMALFRPWIGALWLTVTAISPFVLVIFGESDLRSIFFELTLPILLLAVFAWLIAGLGNQASGKYVDGTAPASHVGSQNLSLGKTNLIPVILLIHGTFGGSRWSSADEAKNNQEITKWWQIGSEFYEVLSEQCAGVAVCHDSSSLFRWSGKNLESERILAGRTLLDHLRRLEEASQAYHIIAHSHGGSVTWNALCDSISAQPLKYLRSWTTIGTPFLNFRVKADAGSYLVPLLISIVGVTVLLLDKLWLFIPGIRLSYEQVNLTATLLVLLAIGAMSISALYSTIKITAALAGWYQIRSKRMFAAKALATYGHLWLCIESKNDEAINSLMASILPGGPLLPRWLRLEPNIKAKLLEPLRWVYNLVASLTDEFVWARIKEAAQGNDYWGLELDSIGPPIDVIADIEEHEERFLNEANVNSAHLIGALRRFWGRIKVTGVHFTLAQELELQGNELIHWQYYRGRELAKIIGAHIRGVKDYRLKRSEERICARHRHISPVVVGLAILSLCSALSVNWFYHYALSNGILQSPDLTGADLSDLDLRDAQLSRAKLERVRLTGADLRGAQLVEAVLRQSDLSSAQVKGANFSKADLSSSTLKNVAIREADFQGTDFSYVDLSGMDLSELSLGDVNFKAATLVGANLSHTTLARGMLKDADLQGAILTGIASLAEANLEGANLSRQNLNGVDFRSANMSRVQLAYSQLRAADFRKAERYLFKSILPARSADLTKASLYGADLSGAELQGGILRGADLRTANLSEANLSNADLSKAKISEGERFAEAMFGDLHDVNMGATDLGGATLVNATLVNADLSDANLGGANLSGSDLTNAVLDGANMSDVKLSNVRGLTPAQLAKACGMRVIGAPVEALNKRCKYSINSLHDGQVPPK